MQEPVSGTACCSVCVKGSQVTLGQPLLLLGITAAGDDGGGSASAVAGAASGFAAGTALTHQNWKPLSSPGSW